MPAATTDAQRKALLPQYLGPESLIILAGHYPALSGSYKKGLIDRLLMLSFSQEKSFENIKSLITASRKIAPGIPWFVAHNSLKNETPYAQQPVRQAQAALVVQGLACAGPDTDVIRDNPDWVGVAGFGEDGLTRHGELWFPVVDAYLREGTCLGAFTAP